ncbi:MAG: UDP-2,3-diacylglucosamine diphosphatase [Tatlockia sp.]|jgi:UDP-2,3-diacylglucosamine hydrolase
MSEKRFDAVFISDLHLHPQEPAILSRFHTFTDWAAKNTESVYILGDFFHVWPGDDLQAPWSDAIAARLKWLAGEGVALFFMRGNRDFLVGERFAQAAHLTLLKEPTQIKLGEEQILLVHGDRYCTEDKSHQWFRKLTRNWWFPALFLRLPLGFRIRLVAKVRQHSQMNRRKTPLQMDVVVKHLLTHLQSQKVTTVIHGHTHKPALSNHWYNEVNYRQFVLSDWDDNPQLLCYNKTNGLKFYHNCF